MNAQKNTQKYVSGTLIALLSLFSAVANAGGNDNSNGGCGKNPGPGNPNPCGSLTVVGNGTTETVDFLSHIKSEGGNQNTTKTLYKDFNQAPFNNKNNTFQVSTGTLEVGSLGKGNSSDIVTFTYLGASAANTDLFKVGGSSLFFNNQTTAIGSTITETVKSTGNVLMYSFTDTNAGGKGVVGILSQSSGYTIDGVKYSDLLLYNDPGSSDKDFNDMIVGVNINCLPAPVSPVPEPQSYAMLLAGLGLVGLTALRRKHKFNA